MSNQEITTILFDYDTGFDIQSSDSYAVTVNFLPHFSDLHSMC